MESKNLAKLQNYQKKLLKLLEEHDCVDDFIFFGSYIKSKSRPSDIDLAILSKETNLSDLKKKIRKIIPHVDIEIVRDHFSPLWPILMREGFSIGKHDFLFNIYGLQPVVLYKYSLKKLNPVQKVQFSRGVKQIVLDAEGKFISRSVVLIPIQHKFVFEELLSTWSIEYDSQSFEMFPVLRKEHL